MLKDKDLDSHHCLPHPGSYSSFKFLFVFGLCPLMPQCYLGQIMCNKQVSCIFYDYY